MWKQYVLLAIERCKLRGVVACSSLLDEDAVQWVGIEERNNSSCIRYSSLSIPGEMKTTERRGVNTCVPSASMELLQTVSLTFVC